MKNYPLVVSCDWFSYSCSCEGGFTPELGWQVSDDLSAHSFVMVETTERHPFYERACLAKEGNAPVAHLFFACKRADNPFSCQIKVDNSRLYYAWWAESLQALVRALHWRIQFVNRIDICCDFNFFANGRSPLSFCQDYLSRPTKGRPSFIRHSSNKLRAVVTRTLHSLNYETLSWGTRDSAVQTNLYNKSLELSDHADKPWIRQRWIEAGLLHGDIGGKKHCVWRVEFSINPSALMLQDRETASVIGQLNINHVSTPAALIETWNVLHPRYFTFHFLTKDASNNPKVRVRDLPIVTLFERDNCIKYKVKGVQYYRKSTRTDRLLLRRLLETIEEDQLNADERAAFIAVTNRLIETFMFHRKQASNDNLAEDTITQYLQSCFADVVPLEDDAIRTQNREFSRRARLWVRMLQGAHDPDIANFQDALRQLEELSGSSTFEQCLRYANYVAGTTMPDEAVSDWVDEEVLREAYVMPSLNSANHLGEAESYQPLNP